LPGPKVEVEVVEGELQKGLNYITASLLRHFLLSSFLHPTSSSSSASSSSSPPLPL